MIIIIGTGLAGYQVAREFRKLDQTTPLTLITADDGKFYPKPQLSTALTNKKTAHEIATATADSMATQLNATILTHTHVKSIQSHEKTIVIDTNPKPLAYEKIVFACGADVMKAPLTGNGAQDVLSINHLYHYAEFEKLILQKTHITILGAGLIGCEFANDLSNAGYDVSVIAPDKSLLERFLPAAIGDLLQTALEKNGVKFQLETTVQCVNKVNSGYCLELANGKILNTDFVLSAIGLRPHIALAKTANVQTGRGILVNRYLETSEKNMYALGDCAEVEGHILPFISPILNCARALAKTLTGVKTPVDYPAMPVVVKTPAFPLIICPPPQGILGQWEMTIENNNLRALFYTAERQLYGFILTNDAIKERMLLVKQIPNLF